MEAPVPRRYLQVPVDPVVRLSSPPCSPLPADWTERVESPPVRLSEFNLDAAEGVVQLDTDRAVDLSRCVAEGRVRWKVVRLGAVVANSAPGRTERSKDRSAGEPLPPIVVDSYE